jgi:putative sigma-54 modulation protein
MELQVIGINIEVTEPIREYADKKVARLLRHLPSIEDAKIELIDEKTKTQAKRFTAQVTLKSKGTFLRGEERSSNVNSAIDAVTNSMERQIERYKGKLDDRRTRGSTIGKTAGKKATASPPDKQGNLKLVKVKHFTVKTMSPEQAVEQMELLSHDFFLFANMDSEAINLVYRRKDGNYGLIEPELA